METSSSYDLSIDSFELFEHSLDSTWCSQFSHPGQSFSLSLCGPISICRANAHMVHMGLKSSTSHYTLFS